MYRTAEDGSAIVYGLPIAPFVPLQHQQVGVTTLNLLANYSFRFARERGWLQTTEDIESATASFIGNDAKPLLEQEGYAHKGEAHTFFYAGVEVSMETLQPHFHYPPIPSTVMLWCRLFVGRVGASSYSVYADLYAYVDGKGEDARYLLGQFRVTTVQVCKATRAVHPLEEQRRRVIEEACARNKAYLDAHVTSPHVARLDARALLATSGVVVSGSAEGQQPSLNLNHLLIDEHLFRPDGTCCLSSAHFRRLHVLRETDMDFNLHLNQLATQQLVVNTFRAALRVAANAAKKKNGHGNGAGGGGVDGAGAAIARQSSGAYSHLLYEGVHPIVGDLLLRRLRIDYVREIPMADEAVEVYLFPLNTTALEKMTESSETARLSELVPIGFFTCGVPNVLSPESPSSSAQERYLSTVGVLHCYV